MARFSAIKRRSLQSNLSNQVGFANPVTYLIVRPRCFHKCVCFQPYMRHNNLRTACSRVTELLKSVLLCCIGVCSYSPARKSSMTEIDGIYSTSNRRPFVLNGEINFRFRRRIDIDIDSMQCKAEPAAQQEQLQPLL